MKRNKTKFYLIPFIGISKLDKNHFLNWEKVLNREKCNLKGKKLFSQVFCLDFGKRVQIKMNVLVVARLY